MSDSDKSDQPDRFRLYDARQACAQTYNQLHAMKDTGTYRADLFLLTDDAAGRSPDNYDRVIDRVIDLANAFCDGEITQDEFKRLLFDAQV
ncbi:MAG: hypothetical protein IMW89_06415 [Ktedonobacteraceae bacterium]|nr:hypothetical protein [Ktedonobacteraceae bacterium]